MTATEQCIFDKNPNVPAQDETRFIVECLVPRLGEEVYTSEKIGEIIHRIPVCPEHAAILIKYLTEETGYMICVDGSCYQVDQAKQRELIQQNQQRQKEIEEKCREYNFG